MSQSAPRRNVSYVKPQEPSFLKAFKAKAGYKEQEITVETKKIQPSSSSSGDDKEPYREDELPTVVLLDGSNVSHDEYHKFMEQQKLLDVEMSSIKESSKSDPSLSVSSASSGKHMFRKPVKRTSSEASSGDSNHTSRPTSNKKRAIEKSKDKKFSKSTNAVKNSSLLSFDEEDDD